MALLFSWAGQEGFTKKVEGLKDENTSEKAGQAASENLKSDTTPSFQFLALLLDLVAQDNDK